MFSVMIHYLNEYCNPTVGQKTGLTLQTAIFFRFPPVLLHLIANGLSLLWILIYPT